MVRLRLRVRVGARVRGGGARGAPVGKVDGRYRGDIGEK